MKKRGAIEVVAGLVLLSLAFIGIIFIIAMLRDKTEGSSHETLCFGTNAAKAGIKNTPVVGEGVQILSKLKATPEACKTIDKGELPEKRAADTKRAIKKDVAAMVEKCWWMWQSGYINDKGVNIDVIDGTLTNKLTGKKFKCISCYTFTIPKKSDIKPQELSEFFAINPYKVRDTSDSCSVYGGYCQDECGTMAIGNAQVQTIPVASQICPATKKCCIPKEQRQECIARGGQCFTFAAEPFKGDNNDIWIPYTWTCHQNQQCFVKKENFQSTINYIHAGGNGYGALTLTNKVRTSGLQPGEQYVVAFNENPSLAVLSGIVSGTAGALTGGLIGAKIGAGIGTAVAGPVGTVIGGVKGFVIGSIGGFIATYSEVKSIIDNNAIYTIDQVVIGTKQELQNECALQ